jgi:hypothetical protein
MILNLSQTFILFPKSFLKICKSNISEILLQKLMETPISLSHSSLY